MLKAVYYYKGYKILTDTDKPKDNRSYFVFRLALGQHKKMHSRRGTHHVSGVLCGTYRSFDNALAYIRHLPNNSNYRGMWKR